jgi:hypothetical protein
MPNSPEAHDGEAETTPVDPVGRGKALDLLIEGEQKLLAVFDARQATADAKTTAAAAGAILLPAATLTLAGAVGNNGAWLKVVYVIVALLAAITVVVRTWTGTKVRKAEDHLPAPHGDLAAEKAAAGRRGKKLSTESLAAARARDKWWACDLRTASAPDDVRELAANMWRTRAKHSRHLAQDKEMAATIAAGVFIVALLLSAVLVVVADWTSP